MMPPFVRRCPDCGSVGPSRSFTPVGDGQSLLECPSCGRRFATVDDPRLN